MAAFHDMTTSHHCDHETSQAITLLEYIQSLIPGPGATQLYRDYIEILISLKSKVHLLFTCVGGGYTICMYMCT